jgi:hypothetical protein
VKEASLEILEAIVIRNNDLLVYSTGVGPTIVPEFDDSEGLPERDPEEVVVGSVDESAPDMIA